MLGPRIHTTGKLALHEVNDAWQARTLRLEEDLTRIIIPIVKNQLMEWVTLHAIQPAL